MEQQIKAKRKTLRNQITRVINKAETELGKPDPDIVNIQAALETIQRLEQNMLHLDDEIMNHLLSETVIQEDAVEAETMSTDDYIEKISVIKVKLSTFQAPGEGNQSRREVLTSAASEYSAAGTKKKSCKLPKIELVKFSGEVRDWLAWWAQFNKIHEDEELHASDKFVYLKQSMIPKSEAESLVNKYQQTEENYLKVIEALKERFGEPKLLRKVHVRDLLQLVISNATSRSMKLSELLDRLEASMGAIEAIGPCKDPTEFLYPIIESCLPRDILVLWQHSPLYEKCGSSEDPSQTELKLLLKFLKSEVKAAQHRSLAECSIGGMKEQAKMKSNCESLKTWRKFKNDIPTAASLATGEVDFCIFCKKNHQSHDCLKAQDMSLDQKKQVVKEAKACFYCLRRNHSFRNCRSYIRCLLCKKRHHAIMCSGLKPTSEVEKVTEEIGKPNLNESPSLAIQTDVTIQGTSHNAVSTMAGVLLKTLYVRVMGPKGKSQVVRMLIDEGSQHSYIKTAVAEKLLLNVIGVTEFKNVCFGGNISELKKRNVFKVQLQSMDRKVTHTVELINDHVLAASPTVSDGSWMKELSQLGISITDVKEAPNEIHILIGSDLRNSIMTRRYQELKCGLVAEETIFGWTLSGRIKSERQVNVNYANTFLTMVTQDLSLPQMWSMEAIGIKDPAEQITVEERDLIVKEEFQNSIVRSAEGRYSVQLPWICEKQLLPSNKVTAEKRLMRATRKLEEQGYYKVYDEIFKQWEEEGIIEKVNDIKLENVHYLPHRPVFKPESLTTPVRPVFDASCKTGNGPSLNDCLEKGPNMLELIQTLLFRFREKAVGGMADIRKAFQMIEIGKEDRDYQRFLWWENDKKQLMAYRHRRVVFGITCSPFILAAVLEHHLLNVNKGDLVIAEKILKSLYVDNVVVSMNTYEEYSIFKNRAISIMANAKMELRQWETNQEVTAENRYTSVLGLKWDKLEDELFCQLPKGHIDLENFKVTKRSVLSVVSQVFDPMGITTPALILPKMLLQESWAASMEWDKEWSLNECEKFKRWLNELEYLARIRVPRFIFGSTGAKIQLHCFSDASLGAYATVIFSRMVEEDECYIKFVASKTRLAPLNKTKSKKITIPRLELMSCLIGVRLTESAKRALGRENIETYYWSDSTTALAWIHRNQDWGTFVGNRIREIRNLSERRQWLHIPGHLNPADLPSRGCSPGKLLESKWWEGPSWLKEDKIYWPSILPEYNDEAINKELRKTESFATVAVETEYKKPKFSSYIKNVRVAAWIRRFISNCKLSKKQREMKPYLTIYEVKNGEIDIIKQIQKNHYPREPNIVGLSVHRGENGLIRVRTRLTYKEDRNNFKNPILLPRKDILVQQLIQYVHKANGHAGTQFTLNKLRENYWIVQGRKTVGNVIRKCTVCRRFSSKSYDVTPAPLPLSRVQTHAMFETTGVDLAGPIILKGGKKAWIVIYTCAVYRGVYFDWIDSLSTQEFLNSLEKFTFLIGRPSRIYSDNGTNFVGAQNLLNQLKWKKLEKELEVKQICWNFNPPTASWWGGWWERLIKSAKELLRKMLGTAKLTFKELTSCLALISYVLNNRPLTTLTEDPEDLRPLTPAMFMRDLPISGLPENNLITAQHLQKGYQKVQNLKEALKKRFRSEYLSLLIQKKNDRGCAVPKLGDIVLVGSDQKKRVEWPLGRIIELLPGRDGKIRVARVRTSTGVLIRPLQRLYPMEMTNTTAELSRGLSASVL